MVKREQVQKVHADASERAERATGASYSRGVKSVASIWGNTSPLLTGPLYLPAGQPSPPSLLCERQFARFPTAVWARGEFLAL